MIEHTYLAARIDADGGPDSRADRACVPWWSFTKTILASTALRLVASGHLSLDDPLEGRSYSLRHLLQHRAGVPNYGGLASYHEAVRSKERPWTEQQMLDRVAVDHLDFEPGHGWCYSNVGYFFVRQCIQKATGQDLGKALQHLVFDPFGLESARLMQTAEDLAVTAWSNDSSYDPGWVYHGLVAGTPGDAARFLHKLMLGDMLPPVLLVQMMAAHPVGGRSPTRPWETTGYGLGLMIGRMTGAGLAMGHSGGGPGSVSAVYHFGDRASPCTVAAFAQGDDEGITEHEVVRLAHRQ